MRFSAQRFGTWEWLDLELPLDTDGPEWALSTYGIMEGTIAPDLGVQKAEDGRLVLEEWGTLVHVETDDGAGTSTRRWTGIVVSSRLQGKEWNVTIREFPGYLDGLPVETLVRGIRADPADLIRQIWQDSQARSWFGVTVSGSTPVRVGTDSDDKVAAARATVDARRQTVDTLNKEKNKGTKELQDATTTLADEVALARAQVTQAQNNLNQLIRDRAPSQQIETARLTVVSRQSILSTAQAAYTTETNAKKNALKNAKTNKDAAQKALDAAQTAYTKAKEKADEDGGAYEIRPEDTPDADQSIRDLCTDTEVEWTTSTKYSDGVPNLTVNIHYPSAGSRRDDLVFEQGVNIITELELERGNDYANASIGVGAGEGDKSIKATIAPASNRMYRPTVFEDKSIKKKDQLLALMRKDLKKRTGNLFVPEIEVIDHELAPMYSWRVGDIIRVSGDVPHFGRYSELHRIVSWQLVGEHRARLSLELAV